MKSMLTTRQAAVLDLIYVGKSNSEIGDILHMSALTVKNHVSSMLRRLDASNRIVAVYRGLEFGLLTPPALKVTVERRVAEPARLPEGDWLQHGNLRLSWDAQRAEADGEPIEMLSMEFRLLHVFMKHPRRVLSRAQIIDYVWGTDKYVLDTAVNVHVCRLRTALMPTKHDSWIECVRGMGYQFNPR